MRPWLVRRKDRQRRIERKRVRTVASVLSTVAADRGVHLCSTLPLVLNGSDVEHGQVVDSTSAPNGAGSRRTRLLTAARVLAAGPVGFPDGSLQPGRRNFRRQ